MALRLSQLDARLRALSQRIESGLEFLVAEVGAQVGEEVVLSTPVDTGFARGNWRPTLNVASQKPVTVLDPTGLATIARIAEVARGFRAGDTLHITNRAPYIGRLNAGSSRQAPAGFVKAAAERGLRKALASRRASLLGR